MESLFEPQGLLSIGAFQSLAQTVFFQLPHVSCYCTEIPLQLASLSNCLVGSSHSVIEKFLSPGLFFPFDHLFGDGTPSIVVFLSLMPL